MVQVPFPLTSPAALRDANGRILSPTEVGSYNAYGGNARLGSKRKLNRTLQSLLISYTDYKNFQALMDYMKAGGDLNIQLDHSYKLTTPLCEASKRYDTCAMEAMFENKVDINLPDGHGNTPILHAAMCHKIGSIYMLLQRGAQLDIVNSQGKTALLVSLENFSNHCSELLIEAGANVNIPLTGSRRFNGSDVLSPLLFCLLYSPSPLPMSDVILRAGALPERITADALRTLLHKPVMSVDFLEILHFSGFKFDSKAVCGELKQSMSSDDDGAGELLEEKDQKIVEFFEEVTSRPLSLMYLARNCVREKVVTSRKGKGHIKAKLKSLPVPKGVVRFLSLD